MPFFCFFLIFWPFPPPRPLRLRTAQVVAEQKAQIAELLERCALLEDEKAAPSTASSSTPGDGTTPSPAVVGDEVDSTAGGGASSCTAAADRGAGGGQRRGSGRGRIGTAEEMGEGRAAASSVVVAGGAAAGEEEEHGEEGAGGVGEALACIGGIAFTRWGVWKGVVASVLACCCHVKYSVVMCTVVMCCCHCCGVVVLFVMFSSCWCGSRLMHAGCCPCHLLLLLFPWRARKP